MKNSTNKRANASTSQTGHDILDDDVDTDELFEGSDDEELFIPRKNFRSTPPLTTRQLVNLVRKNMVSLNFSRYYSFL
jgi:hypothetical protein